MDWFTELWGDNPDTQAAVDAGLESLRTVEQARLAAIPAPREFVVRKCTRCGGAGRFNFRPAGGVCYRCGGSGLEP